MELKKAVQAIWHHYASTEEKPMHQFCPLGANSWCKWQKDQVCGSNKFRPKNVDSAIMEEIKGVFDALSDEELLQKVLKGLSQNPNEALNHMVWEICPKSQFVGPETIETACALAVMLFNGGAHTLEKVLRGLNIAVGEHCKAGFAAIDQQRLYASAQKVTEEEKRKRQKRRSEKKKKPRQGRGHRRCFL